MEQLKQRLFTGWTLTRTFYLVIGIIIIANAIFLREWYGILFGAYAVAMGIFRFGCAAGACFSSPGNMTATQEAGKDSGNIIFEEVNNK